MSDKAADARVPALKLATNNMLENHDNVVFSNDDIDLDDRLCYFYTL